MFLVRDISMRWCLLKSQYKKNKMLRAESGFYVSRKVLRLEKYSTAISH